MVIILFIKDAEGNNSTVFGVVKPLQYVDFPEFISTVKETWEEFQLSHGFGEVEIEDFTDFHNKKLKSFQIDYEVYTHLIEK